jgi:hypothetical protein
MNIPFKSLSQSMQDVFAFSVGGKNKTYIEIGANKPRHKNNTYNLEINLGWNGFSIEFNRKFEPAWAECKERSNICYFDDALTFYYIGTIKNLKLPNHITYLSCDIEPPSNTFAALQRVIEDGISFDCITFEHDNYASAKRRGSNTDYDIEARNYLSERGYRVAVENVYVKSNKDAIFETWFVNNNIDYPTMTYEKWKEWVVNK